MILKHCPNNYSGILTLCAAWRWHGGLVLNKLLLGSNEVTTEEEALFPPIFISERGRRREREREREGGCQTTRRRKENKHAIEIFLPPPNSRCGTAATAATAAAAAAEGC